MFRLGLLLLLTCSVISLQCGPPREIKAKVFAHKEYLDDSLIDIKQFKEKVMSDLDFSKNILRENGVEVLFSITEVEQIEINIEPGDTFKNLFAKAQPSIYESTKSRPSQHLNILFIAKKYLNNLALLYSVHSCKEPLKYDIEYYPLYVSSRYYVLTALAVGFGKFIGMRLEEIIDNARPVFNANSITNACDFLKDEANVCGITGPVPPSEIPGIRDLSDAKKCVKNKFRLLTS